MSLHTRAAAATPGHHNLTGILAMLASMAAFTANDTLVKLAAANLPLGQIIAMRNLAAAVGILIVGRLVYGASPSALAASLREAAALRGLGHLLSWRIVGEVMGTLLFLAALVRMPIADVIAIAQFTPLAITAAAALFFAEPVGWRRWMAAGIGLVGVLLIVRPGSTAFTPVAGLAFASIGFVVLRDLSTRRIPATVPTMLLTFMSAASVMIAGLALLPFETWLLPAGREVGMLALAGLFLAAGYAFIIVAMRAGEVAVVSPFRYSVILWALVAGYLIWGELPDPVSLAGIAIVTAAGIYTFHRERIARLAVARARPAG